MQGHEDTVREIQKQVKSGAGTVSIRSSAPSNTLRTRAKGGIELGPFNKILEFGPDYVEVEPRITFQELCRATLARRLIPPVVPEFTSITVGGAVMGAALESSSHRWGQMNDTCLAYSVVLGNGEHVRATPEENSALFDALSGSYGTLGLLTSVKIRLIPTKKYVNLTYRPLKTEALLQFVQQEQPADYIEAIALDRFGGVAITGEMSDAPHGPLFRQKRPWSKWYVQHVAESPPHQESMLLEEYLFRLDRGAFWMGQYVVSLPMILRMLFNFGNPTPTRTLHPGLLFRLLFGWSLSSERLYRVWHRAPQGVAENTFFVHDFYAPAEKLQSVFHHFVGEAEIFPIWLCPIKGTERPQLFAPHFGKERFVNVGLYGIPKNARPIPALAAQLEQEIADYGGRKMLYSYTYYPRENFAKIYDLERYEALRRDFFAEKAFPHIYNKIVM